MPLIRIADVLQYNKQDKEPDDSILFPVNDIYDMATTLVNLSDEGFKALNTELKREYGCGIELYKLNRKSEVAKVDWTAEIIKAHEENGWMYPDNFSLMEDIARYFWNKGYNARKRK